MAESFEAAADRWCTLLIVWAVLVELAKPAFRSARNLAAGVGVDLPQPPSVGSASIGGRSATRSVREELH
jgi:hypothetical protein